MFCDEQSSVGKKRTDDLNLQRDNCLALRQKRRVNWLVGWSTLYQRLLRFVLKITMMRMWEIHIKKTHSWKVHIRNTFLERKNFFFSSTWECKSNYISAPTVWLIYDWYITDIWLIYDLYMTCLLYTSDAADE